jgi:hypothetical protein
MTLTLRRTNSAAISAARSVRPSAQRYSIATLRPSIQPRPRSCRTNAATHWLSIEGVAGPKYPMVGNAERRDKLAPSHPASAARLIGRALPLKPIDCDGDGVALTVIVANEHRLGPTHTGVFVVHRESAFAQLADLRGCNFVYNSRNSNSGMNLPRRAIAEIVEGERFFGSIVETHSQPGNIERVARREADATCVDSVTYAFFCRHRPQLGALTRVLAATPPSPSIPFVTSVETPVPLQDALRNALRNVARSDEWTDVRSALMLQDIVPIEMASYAVQLQYERESRAAGYCELK